MTDNNARLLTEVNDFGLGRLVRKSKGATVVHYQPYEVSHHYLGILAQDSLALGEPMVLEMHNGHKIQFLVYQHRSDDDALALKRYVLICPDLNIDVEQLFIYSGCLKKIEILTKKKIQATRFATDPIIRVEARTFGSQNSYELETVDISKTGMLLEDLGEPSAPFINNTLLELNLQSRGGWLERPVSCLAKVVRCGKKRMPHVGSAWFGVEIKELDTNGLSVWQEVLKNLSQRSLHH